MTTALAKSPKREARLAERRIQRAREALAKLAPAERDKLLSEVAPCCRCAALADIAVLNPRATIGALAGGLIGAFLGAPWRSGK